MHPLLRATVFALCLLPLLGIVLSLQSGGLGPDPAEAIMGISGEWGLRFLALTLFVTVLRTWLDRPWPMHLRRMFGLYAFFYATMHLATFCHFYIGWAAALLLEELTERPYITLGFLSWLLLLPLALSSTRRARRHLGRKWLLLHRLVYPAVVLACVHLVWQVRTDAGEAVVYSLLFALLLGWRLRRRMFPATQPG